MLRLLISNLTQYYSVGYSVWFFRSILSEAVDLIAVFFYLFPHLNQIRIFYRSVSHQIIAQPLEEPPGFVIIPGFENVFEKFQPGGHFFQLNQGGRIE